MTEPYGQGCFPIRFDWGPAGASTCAADVNVVVDVLSFSTSVCVAVERGMTVLPFPWKDDRAATYAREHDAVLAVGRLEAAASGLTAPSLSPAGLLTCPPVARLVLPSPNGSTISAGLRASGAAVLIGCLRNADAVARRLDADLIAGRSVAVIAAGERWADDDSLRPALEDQLGAGAVLAALAGHASSMSPEASAAAALFATAAPRLGAWVRDCVGGRELAARGFADDVAVAADLNASAVVPELGEGGFTAG